MKRFGLGLLSVIAALFVAVLWVLTLPPQRVPAPITTQYAFVPTLARGAPSFAPPSAARAGPTLALWRDGFPTWTGAVSVA